ncbi:unnamed protein product, partial [Urochloa humidicola]
HRPDGLSTRNEEGSGVPAPFAFAFALLFPAERTHHPSFHRAGAARGIQGEWATMVYVERGVVKDKRTIWRLSIISDFFRAVVNFIRVFFLTMFSAEKTDNYRKGYGSGKKWDGGGGSRGPRTLSDIRSNDHSSLPACGSCCG